MGVTATLNGHAWSSSWSRDSVWPWVSEQALEEGELARTQVDRASLERDSPGGLLEHDRARDKLGLGSARSRPAPAEGTEASGKLLVRERLDEVIVRAGVEPGHAVADRVARSQHQDRDLRTGCPDRPRDLQPGDVRQADVEHDHVDAVGRLGNLDTVPSGRGRLDHVTVLLEQASQQADEARIVLDDQEMHRLSLRPEP